MKICILSSGYPSEGTPIFVFVEQLVINLVRQGVDVVVIAPQSLTRVVLGRRKLLPVKSTINIDNVFSYKVYRPYCITVGDCFKPLSRLFSYFKRLTVDRIVKKEQPTVLYGHFWQNAYLLERSARELNVPLFVACGEGDNAIEELLSSVSVDHKEKFIGIVSGVICVSTENKNKCLKYNLAKEEKLIVLPNSVDTNLFRYDPSIGIREELGINKEDFAVIFCGNFEPRKGPDRLAEAINKLDDNNIKVIFVGRPMPGNSVDPICEGIVFKGSVEHRELPKYLNSADIFVLPTRKEGCCNAIVEALACGLPVISSKGAFNDDILNETNSIRINPDNVMEILEAILNIRNDLQLRQKIVSHLIKTHSSYSLENRTKKIIDFIISKS